MAVEVPSEEGGGGLEEKLAHGHHHGHGHGHEHEHTHQEKTPVAGMRGIGALGELTKGRVGGNQASQCLLHSSS